MYDNDTIMSINEIKHYLQIAYYNRFCQCETRFRADIENTKALNKLKRFENTNHASIFTSS